ncbi:MAG: hypothetical protein ACRCXT_13335 [Paraclostridium sp.]
MSKFLKALSILSGSSEQDLLNTRAVFSDKFGKGKLSCEDERRYVFKKFGDDFYIIIKDVLPQIMSDEESDRLILSDIIMIQYNYYLDTNQNQFLLIFSRVMIHFYNLIPGDKDSLFKSLGLFSEDFARYMREEGLK